MGKKKGDLGDLGRGMVAGARRAAGLRISRTADPPDFRKLPSPSVAQNGEGGGK